MAAPEAAAARLIERLIADPGFRAEFRSDPVSAARAAGIRGVDPVLLERLRAIGAGGIEVLEARESRSSLAGVLMAAAVEGVSLHDLGEHVAARLDPGPLTAPAPLPPASEAAVAPAPEAAVAPAPEAHLAAYSVPDPPDDPPAGAKPAAQLQEMRAVPASSGGGATADAADLLRNHNISFDPDGIHDIKAGKLDPRLASVLDRVAQDHKISVSAIKSDHGRLTAGGSVSNHYYGRALDISVVDGKPVGPGNGAARRVAAGLMSLPASIRPTEVGSPWRFSNPAYFSDAAHQNHLHIGFDNPAPDGWKPPADAGGGGSAEPALRESADPGDPVDADDGDDSEGDDGSVAEDGGSGDTEAEADEESDGDSGGDDEDEDEDDSEPGDHDDDSGDSEDGDDGGSGGESDDSGDSGIEGGSGGNFQDPGIEVGDYPGDGAARDQIAAWMATGARKRGLPPELPIMASLVESGLKNLPGGDADSVGYFQMRVGIWNRGAYAGYPNQAEKQLDWFLDQAVAVKKQRAAAGRPLDSSHYGEWIADVERPAAQYRGRYQPMLAQARQLLEAAGRSGRSNRRQELPAIDGG